MENNIKTEQKYSLEGLWSKIDQVKERPANLRCGH